MSNNKFYNNPDAKFGKLIQGNTVVASDYFKTFMAKLIGIFGGRISVYETLLDRGRREAIIKLLEAADSSGANKVVNLRVESININNVQGKAGLPMIECFAYGTAILD